MSRIDNEIQAAQARLAALRKRKREEAKRVRDRRARTLFDALEKGALMTETGDDIVLAVRVDDTLVEVAFDTVVDAVDAHKTKGGRATRRDEDDGTPSDQAGSAQHGHDDTHGWVSSGF